MFVGGIEVGEVVPEVVVGLGETVSVGEDVGGVVSVPLGVGVAVVGDVVVGVEVVIVNVGVGLSSALGISSPPRASRSRARREKRDDEHGQGQRPPRSSRHGPSFPSPVPGPPEDGTF